MWMFKTSWALKKEIELTEAKKLASPGCTVLAYSFPDNIEKIKYKML
jgi:hypothetical protein